MIIVPAPVSGVKVSSAPVGVTVARAVVGVTVPSQKVGYSSSEISATGGSADNLLLWDDGTLMLWDDGDEVAL